MMAEAGRSIFNRKASEKLRSPDDLDRYVRVTNPSVWILLGACIALLAGLFSWAVFGTLATTVETTGFVSGNEVVCFLSASDAAKVSLGNPATVAGETLYVTSVEARSDTNTDEVLTSALMLDAAGSQNWSYIAHLGGDRVDFDKSLPLSVSITTESIAPISLIFGGKS